MKTEIRPTLKFKRTSETAKIPSYQTSGAAGLDVCADESVSLPPGVPTLVSTGLQVEIPQDWELQVRSRSGLALKKGVIVLNSPGTIDSDYRGTIGVILMNTSTDYCPIVRGDRIAQLVLARAPQALIEEVQELSSTDRGAGGFGSTGR